jgi:carboxymethylenebutenolidase
MGQMKEVGGVPGYWAPATGKGPALIVIQEWWGLDAQTKSIADRFAAEGYDCFAPDFFRGEAATLGDGQTAMAITQKHASHTESDVVAVFDALKAAGGKVGSVGFCFGGRVSLALGVQRKPDAVVTFYGGGMQTLFDRMGNFHSPLLGFFGDKDVSIPAGTIDEFKTLLDRQGVEHEVFVYPNSGHAFFRDSDPHVYKPEAAKDAWTRSKAFFARHLR